MPQLLSRHPIVGSPFDEGKPLPKTSKTDTSRAPAAIVRTGPTLQGLDLQRCFGTGEAKTLAIDNVSLELRKSEMNLLMGPSGSGKSTLLAVLSALLRPDGGQVQALGQDLWRMTEQELERFRLRHCSYVFQGYNLFPALTACQQLEIVLRWGEGCTKREARARSERILCQLGLSKKLHLRPLQLSGGEKQRVAIGRALVKNPSFLFADEPTSALDWENGQQVIELLNDVARQRGATVLVVTHDPRLLPYADCVYEMADGRLQHEPSDNIVDLKHSTPLNPNDTKLPKGRHPHHADGPRLHLQEPTLPVR
jgi:putative ABC transport system ATP-binding protein